MNPDQLALGVEVEGEDLFNRGVGEDGGSETWRLRVDMTRSQ